MEIAVIVVAAMVVLPIVVFAMIHRLNRNAKMPGSGQAKRLSPIDQPPMREGI